MEVGQVAAANGAKERILRYGRVPYEDVDVSAKRRRLFGWLMITGTCSQHYARSRSSLRPSGLLCAHGQERYAV